MVDDSNIECHPSHPVTKTDNITLNVTSCFIVSFLKMALKMGMKRKRKLKVLTRKNLLKIQPMKEELVNNLLHLNQNKVSTDDSILQLWVFFFYTTDARV